MLMARHDVDDDDVPSIFSNVDFPNILIVISPNDMSNSTKYNFLYFISGGNCQLFY